MKRLGALAVRLLPAYGAVTVLAVAWFFFVGGALALDPRDVSWMMRGDWNAHLFGWLFARNAPVTLPLGLAPDLLYPYGSSLGFTDGVPWAGVFFRFLSFALPRPFQYFGLWLLSCSVFAGWTGVALAERRTADRVSQVLVGALAFLAPVLVARLSHPSMCAQWVVLAQVALFFVPAVDARAVRRHAAMSLGLVVLAAGFHLYLAAMVTAVGLAFLLSRAWVAPRVPWKETAAWLGGLVGALLLTLLLLGFFSGPPAKLGAEGFGDFSADVLSLVNPHGWSRTLPAIPTQPRQGEGFAWLGPGVVLLALAALVARFTVLRKEANDWRATLPLTAACAALAVYAFSSRVTVAGQPVLSLEGLYAPLSRLTSMFRTSGRFLWPAMWAVTAASAVTLLRLTPRWVWPVRALLAVAVLLQAGDLNVPQSALRRPEPALPFRPLSAPQWQLLSQDYRHLALHPVHLQWVCRYDAAVVTRFGWEAVQQHLSFNSGHVGRVPADFPAACEAHLPPGPLDAETVYIPTTAPHAADFARPEATCGVLEGHLVCVSSARATALQQLLAGQPDPLGRLRGAPR